MAAEDLIAVDEKRPNTDRPEFHRKPLRNQIRDFGRAVVDFNWFWLFRKKRHSPPSGSQSDRPVGVHESYTWPQDTPLKIEKTVSNESVQSVCPNEAKDWNFIDDDDE